MKIAVLFARSDRIYKTLAADVWDEQRDAMRWPGGTPVVAHPPCRAWGRLRAFARPAPHEKDLARFAVTQIRRYGGVLEHPSGSTLWADMAMPPPGEKDEYGGWTLAAPQKWWGHKCEKASWFYIVGCSPRNIPRMPYAMHEATHVVDTSSRTTNKPRISHADRERTPPALAAWLLELAARCTAPNPAE